MRVLLVHNTYRAEGGEERAVRDQLALLRERGHDVELLERSSASAGRATAVRGMLGGGVRPEEVGAAARRARAEVVHAHNLHPLFGWRALAAARAQGARTVLHLHNFRLFCAIGVAYRDGRPCYRCHDGWTGPGVALRCRGSLGEAAVYAAGLAVQWRRLVAEADRLVAVSAATASRLRALGVRREIDVLPNFVAAAGPGAPAGARAGAAPGAGAEGEFALVAGRLVEEKGFDTAIAAARAAGIRLVVAGDGPDLERLRGLAAGSEVTFTGRLAEDELAALRGAAIAVLVPSRWEEPCPYAALDALAAGVPVIASDRGGLPELLSGQAVLAAEDVAAWAGELSALRDSPQLRAARGARAAALAGERFGAEPFHRRLLEIYGCEP